MTASFRRLLLFSACLSLLSIVFSLGCNGGDDRGSRLDAPVMVAATGGDGHITVTWAPVENAARYLVYSASEPNVTPGDDSLDDYRRDSVGADETEFTLDVGNGSIRWFVVSAVNSKAREGDYSSEVFGIATPWETPDPLEIGSGDALSPKLAFDAASGIYAAWTRDEPGDGQGWEVHATRWQGGAWDNPTAVVVVSSAGPLATALRVGAGGGTGFVAWQQGSGVTAGIYAIKSQPGVVPWSPPARLDDVAGGGRNPELAVDGVGNALAAWVQGGDIRASRYTGAWSASEIVDAGPEPADEVRVGSDAAGNGLAVWTQNGALRAARFTGAWQAPVFVTGTSARASEPFLALHPETGDGIAVWLQTDAQADTDVFAARFDVGTGWSAPQQIDLHPLAASKPSVAVHASGRAIATWLRRNGTRDTVATARFTPAGGWGETYLHDAVAEANSGNASDPSIRFVTDDDAIVSFSQQVSGFGTGAYENVYVHRIGVTDTTSQFNVLIVSRLGLNTEPVMVIGSSGTQTAVWVRYGPAGNEIWFNQR